ncbi:hypothetical protein ACJJVG_08865 [Pseudocitrobacter faecalis]|uniref:hypothetical protein n=1 Tax=Pseudocitrobacter faecalis TaxID=1398493 RepID=UPI003899805E
MVSNTGCLKVVGGMIGFAFLMALIDTATHSGSATSEAEQPSLVESINRVTGRDNCGSVACTLAIRSNLTASNIAFMDLEAKEISGFLGDFKLISHNATTYTYQIEGKNTGLMDGLAEYIMIDTQGNMIITDKDKTIIQEYRFTDNSDRVNKAVSGLTCKVTDIVKVIHAVKVNCNGTPDKIFLTDDQYSQLKKFKRGDNVRFRFDDNDGLSYMKDLRSGAEIYY